MKATAKKSVPRLRFKDDDGGDFPDWEEKRVDEMFTVTRGKVLAMQETNCKPSRKYPYPVYSSQTKANGLAGFYDKFLFENAITWTTDGANAGDVKFRTGRFYCTNVCGVLLNEKGYANELIASILGTVTRKHVSYVGNPKLMNNVMSKISISVPSSMGEQTKIANFLSSVDKRIEQLTQKKSLLEQYKKGAMQQIFSQQIRFKDDDGGDFPDWEEKEIGGFIDMLSGFPFPSGEILDRESICDRPSVLLMRGVNITEGSIRHSPELDRFYCGEVANLEKYRLKAGDMVIGMDGSKVGKNSAIAGENDAGALLVQRVARIRPLKDVSIRYIYQHINSFVFHRYVDRVKTSSGIPHISAKQIREFKIGFPKFEEQTKIANFLSVLDRKIETVASQIAEMQTFKRGLLQQMFV